MGLKSTAIVEVKLRIDLPSNWGASSKIEQVFRQASEDAISLVGNLIKDCRAITLSGKPKVIAVMSVEEQD